MNAPGTARFGALPARKTLGVRNPDGKQRDPRKARVHRAVRANGATLMKSPFGNSALGCPCSDCGFDSSSGSVLYALFPPELAGLFLPILAIITALTAFNPCGFGWRRSQQNNERQKQLALLQDPPSAREALPPELRSLPRPKSTPSLRFAAAPHHLTWTVAPAVVLSALTLLTLFNLGTEWLNYRQLVERGVAAQATVLEKNQHYQTEDALEYEAVYQFYGAGQRPDDRLPGAQRHQRRALRPPEGGKQNRGGLRPRQSRQLQIRENLSAPSPLYAVWLSILLAGLAYFLLFRLPTVLARRNQLQRVLREGQRTRAIVFDRWIQQEADDDDGTPLFSYHLAYAFRTVDSRGRARVVTRGEQVSKEEYEKTPIASVRQAAYLPENPAACLLLEAPGAPS